MSVVVARQPTNWKLIAIVSGAALLLGMLFLRGFWFPYQENKRQLAELQDEYDKQYHDLIVFQKEKERLHRDRLIGLPRNLDRAGSEYVEYVQKLLAKCGFDPRPDVTPLGADLRSVSAGSAKKPQHISVSFAVRAQGSWTAIVKFLDSFQRTAFLHRLRTWTVDAPPSVAGKGTPSQSTKLTMNVTIEALVVSRSEQRPENLWGVDTRLIAVDAILGLNRLPTGWATLLRAQGLLLPEMSKRSYAQVPKLNPFVGGIPISETVVVAKDDPKKKREDDERAAQAKASLVQTDESGQRALLVVPVATDPGKTVGIKLAPEKTFPVKDGKHAKVLRIDHLNVYFQFESKIYGIHVGEKMAEALSRPLSPLESKNLGLPGG